MQIVGLVITPATLERASGLPAESDVAGIQAKRFKVQIIKKMLDY